MIRRLVAAALATLLALAAPRAAHAQATRTDSAAVLLDAARRLEAQGQRAASQAVLAQLLQRWADTPAGMEAARMIAERPAPTEGSGRFRLVAWGTLYGAWLGVAVPAAAGAESSTPYGVGLLLGGPAGLVLANAYARAARPTTGQADAIIFGSQWGTWQGLGWLLATTPDVGDHAPFTALVLGGVGGLVAGHVVASSLHPTAGQTGFVSHAANWGTWYGIVAAVLTDAEDDAALSTVLVAGDVGLLAGALGAPRDVSAGRVWLTSAIGIAGAAAGFGIDLLVKPDEDKIILLIPALTSAVGLVYGWHVTDDLDRRRRPAGAPGSAGAGALLRLGDGRPRLGAPDVLPTLVKVAEGRLRPIYRPALAVALLRATF
jgi:hypothetical protein